MFLYIYLRLDSWYIHAGVGVGQEKLRLKQYFEISGIGSSVPVVSNMASVHDLAENIPEILPGNNLVFGQVIV